MTSRLAARRDARGGRRARPECTSVMNCCSRWPWRSRCWRHLSSTPV